MSTKRIMIAIPAQDDVKTAFCSSLSLMLMHVGGDEDPNYQCGIMYYGSSVLPYSRYVLARTALDLQYTHILYIDSDMMFPRNMLNRMLVADKPILGINAMSRHHPYRCTAREEDGNPVTTTEQDSGLRRVRSTGFGVMWIDMEVFRKMPQPWFNFEWLHDKQRYLGEDFFFCEKARKLGYDVWIDQDLSKEISHMGIFGWKPTMHTSIQKEMDAIKRDLERLDASKQPANA